MLSHLSTSCHSFFLLYIHNLGATETSWLVHSTLERARPGLIPNRGHGVVFLGKTLYSHSASLYPSIKMITSEFNSGGNKPCD